MKRWILILLVAATGASLAAGEFADAVTDLGRAEARAAAIERLAKAGDEALEDLLAGLAEDPEEEGIDAAKRAERSTRRLECARLLGALGGEDAAKALQTQLETYAVEDSPYPLFAGACASAVGRVWARLPISVARGEAITKLKQLAQAPALDSRIRWGALHGQAAVRDGAAEAATIALDTEADAALRMAAMDVLGAAGNNESAAALIAIWDEQRAGEAAGYAKPLGLTALFAAARIGAHESITGLVDIATMAEFVQHPTLREQAVRLMNREAMKAGAVAKLIEVLKDPTMTVRHTRAAQTLGEFGAAGVTAFLALADEPAPEEQPEEFYRNLVDRHLTSLSSEEALKAFVATYRTLDSEESKLRGKVIQQLLNHRSSLKTEGINLLKEAADDDGLESVQRAQCINAFAENRGKDSFNDLVRWAKSEDGEVRAQAVQSLGRTYIPLKQSKSLLIEALQSQGEEFSRARQNALLGLQRSDDRELLPLFVASLDPEKEPSPEVRNTALSAMDSYRRASRVRDDEVFEAAKGRLNDPDSTVRATALRISVALAQAMGQNVVAAEMVSNALQTEEDDSARSQAYMQVATVKAHIDAQQVIDRALKEEAQRMKSDAAQGLAQLDSFGNDETRRNVLELGLALLEARESEYRGAQLLKKAQDGKDFNFLSTRLRERAATLVAGSEFPRAATIIDVLTTIEDHGFVATAQEYAAHNNVQLRRQCVDLVAKLGNRTHIPWMRELMSRSDSAADALRAHIEDSINQLEDRG